MKIFILLLFLLHLSTGSFSTDKMNLLLYSQTNEYRHESIPTGIRAISQLAEQNNWEVFASEDSSMFKPKKLDNFDLVIFLNTSGNLFTEKEKDAFKNYIEKGGKLLAIHTGTFTETNWPWFVDAVGGIFIGHPPTQKATVIIEDQTHPTTKHFPSPRWEAVDEWYSFDRNPREHVHVLVSIDESTYEVDDNQWFPGKKQRMGDHPIVWYKNVGHGIVYQTAFGHTHEMYANPVFLKHIEETIKWLIN